MDYRKIIKESGFKYELRFNINKEDALQAVKQNGSALRYVKDQTESVCLEAVKKNGYALQYVDFTKYDGE